MRTRHGLLLPLALVLAADAAAQIRVDLPDLPGVYAAPINLPGDPPGGVQFSLTLPAGIQSIDDLRLVLSGTMQDGLVACSDPFGDEPDTTAFLPGLSLYLREPGAGDFLHATVAVPPGAFSGLGTSFTSCCPPGVLDPDALLGKVLEAEFFLDWVLILPCNAIVNAAVDISEAHLEITGTVPAEDASWGKVKARFSTEQR